MRILSSCLAGLVPLCLLFSSCSQGGDQKKQSGEVQLPDQAYNYVYLGAGSTMPYPMVFTDAKDWSNEGTMTFGANSQYVLTQVGKATVSGQEYFLMKDGTLTVLNGSSASATLRMPGFLDLNGDSFFFVRNTRPTKGSWPVLFFAGIKQDPAAPTMSGSWSQLGFSLFAANKTTKRSNDAVARSFEGTVTFDSANKVSASTWKDSSTASSTLTGQVTPQKGGEVDLVYTIKSGLYAGTKSWTGFVGKNLAMLYDGSAKDQDLGLAFLVREMDADAKKTSLQGTYSLCNFAMLTSTTLQGADIATGTLTFKLDDTFVIDLKGPLGAFQYSGKYKIGTKGRLTLEVTDNNQSWFAVVTKDYDNVVIVDGTWEKTTPELGFYLGVRVP